MIFMDFVTFSDSFIIQNNSKMPHEKPSTCSLAMGKDLQIVFCEMQSNLVK